MTKVVLSVKDLVVEIPVRDDTLRPVDRVSYDIAAGEILGVVGESGAGKSMTGNAVIGLLDRPAHIASGSIELNGRRIDNLSREELRKLRGKEIGMVFQDPLTSLNPLLTVGEQLTETIREHLPLSAKEADERALAAREEVGIPAASKRMNSYPHEFSGGMRQRVVIALALCAEPSLVIADEPTTALDVSVQAQIISLLKRLCRERGTAVMLVTHDMGGDRRSGRPGGRHVCRTFGRTWTGSKSSDRTQPSLYGRSDGFDSFGVSGPKTIAANSRRYAQVG